MLSQPLVSVRRLPDAAFKPVARHLFRGHLSELLLARGLAYLRFLLPLTLAHAFFVSFNLKVNKSAQPPSSLFMQQRKRQGFVRECHGDLHLGNMTLIDGKVVIFDCIEFNPFLRWVDVISEAAFLVMEHWIVRRYGLARINEAFFTMNAVISVAVFAFTLGDLLVGRMAA